VRRQSRGIDKRQSAKGGGKGYEPSQLLCRHGERQRQHAASERWKEAGKGKRIALGFLSENDKASRRRTCAIPAWAAGRRRKGAALEIDEALRPVSFGEHETRRVEAAERGGIQRLGTAVLIDRQVFVQFQLQMPLSVQAPVHEASGLIRE